MKKSALLSSIIVIALCFSIIAGSTFALFTDDAYVDLEIDAGNAEITASLTTPHLYSVTPDANGDEYDENGRPYVYQDLQDSDTFLNGGTAKLNGAIIELVNVTPGDKIEFTLNGMNAGDVALQYRYRIECIEGYDLMSGFIMTVEGTKYASMASYVSEWNKLEVGESIDKNADANAAGVALALELPVSAGNEFQELSASVKITVEAVQQNADTKDENGENKATVKYITTVDDAGELAAKINSDEILHIFVNDDINDLVVVNTDITDKTIDGNGNNVRLQFGTSKDAPIVLKNVVVTNVNASTVDIKSGARGDLSFVNCEFVADTTAPAKRLINGAGTAGDGLSVTVEGGLLDGKGVTESAVYFMNIGNLTLRDVVIKNTTSWAVMQANGQISGNVVMSGCTFQNCKGLTKGAINGGNGNGSLSGNFTFANNTILDCAKKESKTNSGIFVYMNVSPVLGTITFSNNTDNGVVVTVEDMGMLG